MSDAVPSSEEQLDALLREGRISPEDYDTLQQALSKGNVEDVQRRREAPRGKLMKKWEGRQLGGVCAGLGEFFGLDPWSLRAGFVLAFFLTGGTALLVYLVLSFTLPWAPRDEVSMALERKRLGASRAFLVSLIALWFLGLLFNHYIVSQLLQIAQGFNLHLSPLGNFLMRMSAIGETFFGLALQVLLLGSVYLAFRMAPAKGALRRWIFRLVMACASLYFLAWLWTVFSFQSLLATV